MGVSLQHDAGCCLVRDGRIVAAISEERLARRRGASGAGYALQYCLAKAGITLEDVDLAVFSSYGERLPAHFDGGMSVFGLTPERSTVVDHHLSHAYSTFYLSPFKEALIAVVDTAGNNGQTESYFVGTESRIQRVGGNRITPTRLGIGRTYEAFTGFLGWNTRQAANTMALAAYGDPETYRNVELFQTDGYHTDSLLRQKYWPGVVDFAERSNLDFGKPMARGSTQRSRDIAWLVQNRTERALQQALCDLLRRTHMRRLCLAGGVALNCVMNLRLLETLDIDELFVTPAANDQGQCIGNALYGWNHLAGGVHPEPPPTDFHGQCYSDAEIKAVITRRSGLGRNYLVESPDIRYEKPNDLGKIVAQLLTEGNIVAWFQGAAEMGPRALGHRSILIDPRRNDVMSRLSATVKGREWFRPYAPSIMEEHIRQYFAVKQRMPFMNIASRVLAPAVHNGPTVVHVDGTARVHGVRNNENPEFHNLLREFFERTGVPMLLNTSFNLPAEPIVETPNDALSVYLRSGIDALAIGPYLVHKV